MISLDVDLSSGFVKKNDRIPFTVLQNVYANTKVPYPKAKGDDGSVEEMRWKRCVAIAKGTKVYGTVEKSKEAYPFYLNGKSRLSVVVTELKLESSDSVEEMEPIRISFIEPKYVGTKDRLEQAKNRNYDAESPYYKCRTVDDKRCIRGRRSNPTLPVEALGSYPAAWLAARGDGGTTDIGITTGVQALLQASSVSDLVNPPKATLGTGMIFEVKLDAPRDVWVPLAAPPKKEDK